MSIFKPFITSDVIVSPFEVNKSFTFQGTASFSDPNVSIERYIGKNITSSLFVSGSYPTGIVDIQNQQLIYRSIRELYYTNFLKDPKGSPASTASFQSTDFVPDLETAITLDNEYPSSEYNVVFGDRDTTNYYNYLSNTLTSNRSFPTSSNALIGVLSIPSNLFGEYLKPGSFTLKNNYGTIIDDANGNLLFSNIATSSLHVGNIIYEHGIAIINEELISSLDGYGYVTYGSPSPPTPVGIYGGIFGSLFNTNNITCSFQSTVTIYESQYKCTIRQNEFNFSQNPTLVSGSSNSGIMYDYATGSYFDPYITTVGLYNNNYELIAVAKLAQPLPLSSVTDTTILVNLDL
jgi:hypothetical protein